MRRALLGLAVIVAVGGCSSGSPTNQAGAPTPAISATTEPVAAPPSDADVSACSAFPDAISPLIESIGDVEQSGKSSPLILGIVADAAAKKVRVSASAASEELQAAMLQVAGNVDLFSQAAAAPTSEGLDLSTEARGVTGSATEVLTKCKTLLDAARAARASSTP